MKHRMFTVAAAALLLVSTGACAVIGYPAPLGVPAVVTASSRADAAAADAGGDAFVRAAVRSYEVFGQTYTTLPTGAGYREVGVASWYGEPFHGRPTANGETFDMYALTAAHRTLPLSTCVLVRRTDDDREITVRVNDRGPFSADNRRIIDLSYSAGSALGLIGAGTAEVEVRALEAGTTC
jgi:rare lipoprotein A